MDIIFDFNLYVYIFTYIYICVYLYLSMYYLCIMYLPINHISMHPQHHDHCQYRCIQCAYRQDTIGGGLGSSTIFKNLMSPTPRRKWYLMTGRRAHQMVLDPIPQSLPVHFFGSRTQPPTSPRHVTFYIIDMIYVYMMLRYVTSYMQRHSYDAIRMICRDIMELRAGLVSGYRLQSV